MRMLLHTSKESIVVTFLNDLERLRDHVTKTHNQGNQLEAIRKNQKLEQLGDTIVEAQRVITHGLMPTFGMIEHLLSKAFAIVDDHNQHDDFLKACRGLQDELIAPQLAHMQITLEEFSY